MALTKKTRFEVFKRDKFICQYCGQSAPAVVLQADHIHPRSKGGTDDLTNLITSCFDCNQGKKDRLLSDDSAITKQKQQLDLLQERREQLDLLIEWQKELASLGDYEIEQASGLWANVAAPYHLNDQGVASLRKMIRTYGISEVIEAIRVSTEHYLEYKDGEVTKESVEYAWQKVSGVCRTRKKMQTEPDLARLYYIRGILRNRLNRIDEAYTMQVLKAQLTWGVSVEDLEDIAKQARSLTHWYNMVDELREEAKHKGGLE